MSYSISPLSRIHNIVHSRFSRLLHSGLSHPSSLICSIFTESILTCNSNFNFLYGQSYCRCYLPEHTAIANLIRDIRNQQLFVPGFDQHELDSIVGVCIN